MVPGAERRKETVMGMGKSSSAATPQVVYATPETTPETTPESVTSAVARSISSDASVQVAAQNAARQRMSGIASTYRRYGLGQATQDTKQKLGQ